MSVRLRGERKRGGGVCECEVSALELVKKGSDVDTESEKIERMGVERSLLAKKNPLYHASFTFLVVLLLLHFSKEAKSSCFV